MRDFYRHSVEVLLTNQAPTGAFLATPHMPDYHYCWFRDGSYVAYALDLAGHPEASRRFHDWSARVIAAHVGTVERAEQHAHEGQALDAHSVLHTRYTVEGTPGAQEWANFQLDGFGTWLWAASEHLSRTGEKVPEEWEGGLLLTARYLAALWREPNYDLWEENGDKRHAYTQSAVYGGLAAAASLLDRPHYETVAGQVRDELVQCAGRSGHFTKFLPRRGPETSHPVHLAPAGPIDAAVDGSLVGVALPYGVLEADDPLMVATVGLIEKTLRPPGGGVHRFMWDTYYGGGEWLLLAAWLAWYYVKIGALGRAHEIKAWVEAQATSAGEMPEQVPETLIAPELYEPWVQQRGPIACPLLWSHAQYIILEHALRGDA